MKKLNRLLQAIFIALTIYLLYRLFGKEEHTRLDSILAIISGLAGLTLFIKEALRRKSNNPT